MAGATPIISGNSGERNKDETKTEATPLVDSQSQPDLPRTIGYSLLVIVFSVGLISFNNYLMKEHRFPFAGFLVLIHMTFCSCFSWLLLVLRPSLFPSLTERRVALDSGLILRGALPIAAFSSASLILANLAYKELSMAFLQMLKESGIVTVYVLSLVAGLETFSSKQVKVISMALLGASLTIKGELHFVMSGFLMQMTSQVCECCRIVLQSLILSGRKLDPMTYVLLISPMCFLLLGGLTALVLVLPVGTFGPGLAPPSLELMWNWAPLLLANCFMAFGLNVSIAVLIKNTSAMTYIFCGVLKDVIAVLVSVFIVGERVSHLQIVAFCIQVSSVVAWSLLKTDPESFEDGLLMGLFRSLCGFPRPSGGSTDHVLAAAGAAASCGDVERAHEVTHGGKAT